MKKELLILMMVLLVLPFVSADLTYKPEETADLTVSCFDSENVICSVGSECNITTFLPNMTILLDNVPMTQQIAYFNYTTPSLTSRGQYYNIVNCYDATTSGYTSFTFIVTDIPGTEQGNVAVGILLSLGLVAFLFIYVGFKFADYERTFPIALFFILISIVICVYMMHLGYVYGRDLLVSNLMESTQFTVYFGIMYSLLGIAFIAFILFIIKVIGEIKVRKSMITYGEGYNTKTKTYE